MEPIIISIPGEPMAKQSFRYGKHGSFQPAKIKKREDAVKLFIKTQLPRGFKPFETGVKIEYQFIFPYVKSASKKLRNLGNYFKTTRPDVDNLQKFINDTLNGLIIIDDGQICHMEAVKMYGEKAETILRITSI